MNDQKLDVKNPDDFLIKIFFDFYAQGFFHSSFNFNGETTVYNTEEEAKEKLKLLKDNFNKVLSDIWNSHSIFFNSKKKTLDFVRKINNEKLDTQISYQKSSSTELTICPLCKKKIYRIELNLQGINKSEITNYPFPYIHFHSYIDFPPHVLIMYLDSDLKVRGKKVTKYFVKND